MDCAGASSSVTPRKRKRRLVEDLQDFLIVEGEDDHMDVDGEYVSDGEDLSDVSTDYWDSELAVENSEAEDDSEDFMEEVSTTSKHHAKTSKDQSIKKRLRKKAKRGYYAELDPLEDLLEDDADEEVPQCQHATKTKPTAVKNRPEELGTMRPLQRRVEEYVDDEEVKAPGIPVTPTNKPDPVMNIPSIENPPGAPKRPTRSKILSPSFDLSDYDALFALAQEPCPDGLTEQFSRFRKERNVVAKMPLTQEGGANFATKTEQLKKTERKIVKEIKDRVRSSHGKHGNPAIKELCNVVQSFAADQVLLKKLTQMSDGERFKILARDGETMEEN